MHKDELPRLNRIAGQVEGIRKMITTNRDCTEILTQLRAARAALKTVEANVLEHHLHSCIAESMASDNPAATKEKIEELKSLFKRFDT